MRKQIGVGLLLALTGGLVLGAIAPARADQRESPGAHLPSGGSKEEANFIRPRATCPTELEPLTQLLLRDLPAYANRVTQRSRRVNRVVDVYNHVVLAGRPEFTPLTLGPGVYTPTSETPEDLEQVFFTTRERQYIDTYVEEVQVFHWLFLAQTDRGWWLALMVSQAGGYPDGQPISPVYDSSEGAIAQGIRLWLRDCQVGAIAPPDASSVEAEAD